MKKIFINQDYITSTILNEINLINSKIDQLNKLVVEIDLKNEKEK